MQDRVSLYPGRIKLTPVSGQNDVYDMERADQPTQEGTLLNKNNLLKDATAALYGLENTAVPDDVLAKLSGATVWGKSPVYIKVDKLGNIPEGRVIKINENGTPVDFIVAKHNYQSDLNGDGRTLLVRKEVYPAGVQYSTTSSSYWASNSLTKWEDETYLPMLDEQIQELIATTNIVDYGKSSLARSVFTLSATEYGDGSSPVLGEVLPTFSLLRSTVTNTTWTRTPNTYTSGYVVIANANGQLATEPMTSAQNPRPAFTLPSDYDGGWYIDEDENIHLEQVYKDAITDVLGNTIGIPGDQIVGGVKIATGSYTGTGTYGASNPNSLTFDFEPKFFAVQVNNADGYIQFGIWAGGVRMMCSSSSYLNIIAASGNQISWYNTGSAVNQLNYSGYTYKYIAIG